MLLVLIAALAVAVGLAACGGDDDTSQAQPPPPPGSTGPGSTPPPVVGDLPDGVIARVGDSSITQAELDRLIEQQRAGAEQSGQSLPEEGTPQFDALRRQAMEQLVLQRVVDFESRKCGRPCAVSGEDVTAEIGRITQTNFNGSEDQFNTFLEMSGLTLDDARQLVRFQLQQPKLFTFVTKKVRFTAAEAKEYYDANTTQFTVPAGRTARHILVATKAEADRIRARVSDASFARIAMAESTDTGSGAQGGDLGQIQKGTLVPEFEKVAFRLKDGEISDPVKTQFGWHVIQVRLTEATVTPFEEARAGIVSSQLGQKRQAEFDMFRIRVLAEWGERTVYADATLAPQSTTSTAPITPGQTTTVPVETAPTETTPTQTAPSEVPTVTVPAGTAPTP